MNCYSQECDVEKAEDGKLVELKEEWEQMATEVLG